MSRGVLVPVDAATVCSDKAAGIPLLGKTRVISGDRMGPFIHPGMGFFEQGGCWEDGVFCGDMRKYRKN